MTITHHVSSSSSFLRSSRHRLSSPFALDGISNCFTLNHDPSAVSTTPCKMLVHSSNPYASIDVEIAAQTSMRTLQGPCGSSAYQRLTPSRETSVVLPIIDETRMIIEERYSNINGTCGWVRDDDDTHTLVLPLRTFQFRLLTGTSTMTREMMQSKLGRPF